MNFYNALQKRCFVCLSINALKDREKTLWRALVFFLTKSHSDSLWIKEKGTHHSAINTEFINANSRTESERRLESCRRMDAFFLVFFLFFGLIQLHLIYLLFSPLALMQSQCRPIHDLGHASVLFIFQVSSLQKSQRFWQTFLLLHGCHFLARKIIDIQNCFSNIDSTPDLLYWKTILL